MQIATSIIVFFALAWNIPASANPSAVKEKNCAACHRFSIDDPNHKAPGLFYAGNKFQENWLKEFLKNPYPIRQTGYTTDPGFAEGKPAGPHISLPGKDAEEMARYLMTLKLPEFKTGNVGGPPLSKGERAKLKILFERNYGCTSCHEALNLAGRVRGGVSGPSLVNAGDRLTADWIFNWLRTPKMFLDRGRMPVFDFDDETAARITKYILTIRDKK